MELKSLMYGGAGAGGTTFNRTAYGIEIFVIFIFNALLPTLLIAPLMELKYLYTGFPFHFFLTFNRTAYGIEI